MIVVLTRDGRLPKDGGIRVGYMCESRVFLYGGSPDGVSIEEYFSPKLAQPAKEVVVPIPRYNDLPRAIFSDGQCSACERYPNEASQVQCREGMKSVVVCKHCGNMMRPFHD